MKQLPQHGVFAFVPWMMKVRSSKKAQFRSHNTKQCSVRLMSSNRASIQRPTTARKSLPELPQEKGVHRFVFLRHGESEFNNANVFTGWCDVALTQRGVVESIEAGQVFASHGLIFRKCYCSLLTRSIVTAHRALEAAGIAFTPLVYDWRLNERHYGALQGLSKERTAERLGRELVMRWRRSYEARPPAMLPQHPHYDMIQKDPRYQYVSNIPNTESLQDCQLRAVQAWNDILEDTRNSNNNNNNNNNIHLHGQNALLNLQIESKCSLVVAHANTLRALVMHLDDITEDEIEGLNIPTAIPFYYNVQTETGQVLSPFNTNNNEDDADQNLDTIGLGRFRGVYIADERKKFFFLERRRAANDPFRWALYDHQVDPSMLVEEEEEEKKQETKAATVVNLDQQMHELEKEAEQNTKLFSPKLTEAN